VDSGIRSWNYKKKDRKQNRKDLALHKSVRWTYLKDCMQSCPLHLKKVKAELEKGDRVLKVMKYLPHED